MVSFLVEVNTPFQSFIKLNRFHDSSIPPKKCAKSSESVPKPEKVWRIAILQYKCYFCSTNAIFAVQMLFFCSTNDFLVCQTNFLVCRKKNFERTVQTFAAICHKFCRLMARVLPPYGGSFAVFWSPLPSTNEQSAVQKSVAFSRGGGGCMCAEVSLRTTCCCQK